MSLGCARYSSTTARRLAWSKGDSLRSGRARDTGPPGCVLLYFTLPKSAVKDTTMAAARDGQPGARRPDFDRRARKRGQGRRPSGHAAGRPRYGESSALPHRASPPGNRRASVTEELLGLPLGRAAGRERRASVELRIALKASPRTSAESDSRRTGSALTSQKGREYDCTRRATRTSGGLGAQLCQTGQPKFAPDWNTTPQESMEDEAK